MYSGSVTICHKFNQWTIPSIWPYWRSQGFRQTQRLTLQYKGFEKRSPLFISTHFSDCTELSTFITIVTETDVTWFLLLFLSPWFPAAYCYCENNEISIVCFGIFARGGRLQVESSLLQPWSERECCSILAKLSAIISSLLQCAT